MNHLHNLRNGNFYPFPLNHIAITDSCLLTQILEATQYIVILFIKVRSNRRRHHVRKNNIQEATFIKA